ncbi:MULTISPECIES: DUF2950 family protein [unclassified Rhizobium]|uniref:DUF2950 family protein n=1 Tax=unclassified Rhizobium TaxID=2613769 RepID=UPI0006FC98E5|nr:MULTISPECIES: DUF2950 family protein [unclassified Rhizobium]KQV35179.1 hypothetical protein ASC86_13310 [Rhizobium sp. Root1212]KRD24984.1 hypothetical protein ASE37_13305 [Rhizobium sp. Root268]
MMKMALERLTLSVCAALLLGAMVPGPALAADDSDPPLDEYISATAPPTFDTPEKAVDAFKQAVGSGDFDKLAALLGLDAAKAKASDGATDAYADIQAGVKQKVMLEDQDGGKVLEIGNQLWPLPFPLVKGDDGKWSFDTYAGLEEIADRRVGENELSTIDTMRDYVDAQEDYASEDRDEDGVLEYAQKLISSEGKHDGLYWPSEQGDGDESPAGAGLVDGNALAKAKAGLGYNGYRYRILTGQGENVAGGKFDYIINGNMIAGFGLVAWPVKYGITGVQTFVINKSGILYEADLGDDTSAVADKIRTFNPGDTWKVVPE